MVVSLDIIRILLRYIIGYFWILLRTNAVTLLGYCVLFLAYDVEELCEDKHGIKFAYIC